MIIFKNIEMVKELIGTGSINIFGRPFSGKDTQAKRLAEILNGFYLSSGDIIRHTTVSDHARAETESGEMMPTNEFQAQIVPYLKKPEFQSHPLILSSFGRMSGEEESVIQALKESNHELRAVINLEITEEESVKRWNNKNKVGDRVGRKDDSIEVLTNRFKKFNSKTLPVIDYYKSNGLLIKIDGTGDRDKITQDIINHLYTNFNTKHTFLTAS